MWMYMHTSWLWNQINQYLGSSGQKTEAIYGDLH